MINSMNEPCRRILRIVNEFGGITHKQVTRLLPGIEQSSREYYLNQLKIQYLVEKTKGRFTLKNSKNIFSEAMEMSLWVLLSNLKEEDGSPVTYVRGVDPAQITFIKNNICYNVMYVNRNNISSIVFLEQRYRKEIEVREKMRKHLGEDMEKEIFVIKDLSVRKLISDMDLIVPSIIAYLHFDQEGFPNMEYYQ